jgi:hypothetical protein
VAFRYDGSTGFLANTAAPLPSNNFTMCCWVRPHTVTGSVDFYMGAGNTSAIGFGIGLTQASPARWGVVDAGITFGDFPTAPKADEWFFLAMTHNGTTLRGFQRRRDWRMLQLASIARTSATLTALRFGDSTFDGTDFADGRAAGLRIWSRILSFAEILKESFSLAPVNRARLYAWAQEDSLADLSGFGRTFAKTGTVNREPGPDYVPVFNNPNHLLDRVNTTATAASADLSSAGAAAATFTTQSTASADISSTAASSAVFTTNALWPAAISVASTAAGTVFAATSRAKADISAGGSATATFTTVSTASAALVMAGVAAATFSTTSLASAAIAMAGASTVVFDATSTGAGSADLIAAGSASAVFAAQSSAFADILSSSASSVVFDATSTGGTPVVETPAPPSQAVGGPGGGGRGKRRKRRDEELALIAEAMSGVIERMVRGGLIEDEIEIPLDKRTLH